MSKPRKVRRRRKLRQFHRRNRKSGGNADVLRNAISGKIRPRKR